MRYTREEVEQILAEKPTEVFELWLEQLAKYGKLEVSVKFTPVEVPVPQA